MGWCHAINFHGGTGYDWVEECWHLLKIGNCSPMFVRGFALHTQLVDSWCLEAMHSSISCHAIIKSQYVICSLVLWLMRMISVQNLFMWNMLSVIRLVIGLILPKKTMLITKLVSLYLSLNKKNCERREKEGKVLFKRLLKPLDWNVISRVKTKKEKTRKKKRPQNLLLLQSKHWDMLLFTNENNLIYSMWMQLGLIVIGSASPY